MGTPGDAERLATSPGDGHQGARRPRLLVLSAPGTEGPDTMEHLDSLAEVEICTADELADRLPGAEVLLLWDFFSTALRDAWHAADALRWVHVAAAGVDTLLFPALADSDVVVTNAAGVFDEPIAEFVLAAILGHDKQLHRSRLLQQQRRWLHRELARTAGSRALIVGTGGIGRRTARLLRAVGVEVRGAGRTAHDDDPDLGTVVASAELADHVGWADHVVLAAPLTDETRGLVDAEVLAAMKPTAHLINVARGPLVDEDALLRALREGRLGFATLDVFVTEPLPDDHPFWGMDNVAISAHMCGDVVGWRSELASLFATNLARYVAGEPLLNEIDTTLGYAASSGT